MTYRRSAPGVLVAASIAAAIILPGTATCLFIPEGESAGVEALFYGGRIYTMSGSPAVVEAVAVGNGKIIHAGTTEELEALCGKGVERYDLAGYTVIPGMVDAHAHFSSYAVGSERLDLVGCESPESMAVMIGEAAGYAQKGQWITGRGWDQNDWETGEYPDRDLIDPVSPDNPVLMTRVCGHAAVANSLALKLAGVDASTPDPEGGMIGRDAGGEPTGILIDDAIDIVREIIPPLPRSEKKRLIVKAAGDCLAAGLTGVHDMGVGSETMSIYRELYGEEALPFRLTVYYGSGEEDLDSLMAEGPVCGFAGDRLSVAGVKFYSDGSLGARSAALLEDYSDYPGNRGILVTDPDLLFEKILECHDMGFQVAVHAIGDRANRLALDVLEKVLERSPRPDMRHRIEHVQIISPDDIPRFHAAGIVPSMQFTHCTSDMPWVEDRIGRERLAGAYAWRSFISSGCRIPGGSDFPVESKDPLLGVYAAVTRMDLDGNPAGGWYPEQKLSVEEAVRAFTIDAAWAVHQEKLRGSIEEGKLADFVVLSDDIMEIEPEKIPGIKVLATVLGGRIEFRSSDCPF